MIYFDTRGHNDIWQLLSDITERRLLSAGDCFWMGQELTVGAELKTPGDLMSSIVSSGESTGLSRFYVQMQKLTETYDIPILMVYGVYSPTKDGMVRIPAREMRWRYASLEALLFACELRGVIVVKQPSAHAAALTIRAFYELTRDSKSRPLEMRKTRLFSFTARDNLPLKVITSLPEINVTLGNRVWEHFGTVRSAITATDWTAVRGIGPKTSALVQGVLDTAFTKKDHAR